MTYYVQFYRGKTRINLHIVGEPKDFVFHLKRNGYERVTFVPTLFRG